MLSAKWILRLSTQHFQLSNSYFPSRIAVGLTVTFR